MTPEQTRTAARKTSLKLAWDNAPAGLKMDAVLRHYQAAEKARIAMYDIDRDQDAAPPEQA